jgi:hypothetical protein
VKHQLATAAVAALAIAVSLVVGEHRKGALVGSSISGLTALGSVLAIGRSARGAKPMNAALAVMAIAFLLRIVLVALGTVLVVRAGESVVAFVIAFFVTYFVFAAIEAAYLHSLRHGTGPTA